MNDSENNSHAPLIVAFVADLMFTTRIQNVVDHLGWRIEWIETAVSINPSDSPGLAERPGESLHGTEGKLFEQITAWQSALLLFDLNNKQIPWRRWMPILKSSPATRRLPILAFGPHEDKETMQAAKKLGANFVVGRSRYTSAMLDLLQKYARTPDHHALAASCAEPLAELAKEGIELFNQGEYYKCHDALEEAWMEDQSPARELYRGILQVGIAIYQIERGNYRGAVKMLLRLRQWLDPLPPVCRGVNIAKLRDNAAKVQAIVTELGPERLDEFDTAVIQPIEYHPL
jgi:predicted metal-dependent hydrolase